ncbi:allergen Tha p 1-like [Leptidea sinapis]|uniref:Uncharacterized protein n=1 Tax=Leptidea sinapis TaxID=189913 RepID=A0A5E4QIJ1_9NEOP|nr:allergen Tha p 1-like [Leptidea sinapis]VVC97647.1 unnamed protein product [Leptidea sinapis]
MARVLIILCCVVGAIIAEEYSSKYDNINVQEIIDNKRLLESYAHCVLDKGKCTPEGKELKEHIIDALETGCSKCTEKQKSGTELVITHLVNNERAIWEEACAKYDPEGKYKAKYEDLAKEKGLKI